MEKNVILSKQSGAEELKQYFSAVLKLSESDNEFPVNLDEVWMLVYSNKDKAIRALKQNFMEGVDFEVFAQNGENPKGGRPTDIYHLSLSCLEYFIARKVRPVFDVYRQVFHKAARQSPTALPSNKELALMVIRAEEEKERLMVENRQQQEQIERKDEQIHLQEQEIRRSASKVDYYDNVMQSVNTLTATQVAKQLGMDANRLNRKLREAGLIYHQNGQWLLHQPYSAWGLHAIRTQTYTRSDGSTGTSCYTVWTNKGARLILAMSQNEWNIKKAVRAINNEDAA